MSGKDKIFAYCERGLSPAFWAEPLNAISNAAFIIAAVLALMSWQRWRYGLSGKPRSSGTELVLILVVIVIGIGSFLFHTFATRWAMVADVVPITVFMLVYLGYALRRFVKLGWFATIIALLVFVATLQAAEGIRCGTGACLNGSAGYLPAFAALAVIGVWLGLHAHPAARWILGGAMIFAVSLTFRTLDRAICPHTTLFAGRQIGTHVAWHILNATLLYVLMIAAIRHGGHKST